MGRSGYGLQSTGYLALWGKNLRWYLLSWGALQSIHQKRGRARMCWRGLQGRASGCLLLGLLCCLLGLLLRPLLQHADAALRQQDRLIPLHERVALDDELVLLVG